jgi:hypothetical protein
MIRAGLAATIQAEVDSRNIQCKGASMFDWFKRIPPAQALGWGAIGLLAILIVLIFVRRLTGFAG